MKPLDRRSFLKNSLLGAAAVTLARQQPSASQITAGLTPVAAPSAAPGIIDTNVTLFHWPFRALKYRDTKALVAKRALVQRINRALRKDDEVLKATRGARARSDLGEFYVVDTVRNAITDKRVDLEALGRKLDVLQAWEAMTDG